MKKILLLVIIAALYISCTSEENTLLNEQEEVQQENTPETPQPTGTIFSDPHSFIRVYNQERINVWTGVNTDVTQNFPDLTGFGICYGTSPDVTLQTGTVIQNPNINYQTTDYEMDIQNAVPGTTYYIKPFAMNGDIPVYGTEKTVTTLQPLTVIKGKNFSREGMTIEVKVNDNLQGVSVLIPNLYVFTNVADNLYSVDVRIINVTTLGSIVAKHQNILYYTGFNTIPAFEHNVGQPGEGGGVIIFDKGEYSEGWRYIERSYQGSSDIGFGCNGTSIATQQGLQSGYDNTIAIISACNENSAAKFCYDLVLNSKDDWYLPSSQEAKLFARDLVNGGQNLSGRVVSSSQASSTTYYMAKFSHHYDTEIIEVDKNEFGTIIPVRRY